MNLNYDPNLRMAMAEIDVICKKYNCIGFTVLNNSKNGEFAWSFPEWSVVQVERQDDGTPAIRLKAKGPPTEAINTSIGALLSTHRILAAVFAGLSELICEIKKKSDIKHWDGPLNNDDRGSS